MSLANIASIGIGVEKPGVMPAGLVTRRQQKDNTFLLVYSFQIAFHRRIAIGQAQVVAQ